LQNLIRTLIVAPPGQTLVVVDASQIEARGTDWIAGQEDYLELWRNDEPVYERFAQAMFRCPFESVTKKMRQGGKVGILGGGYGMGDKQMRVFSKNTYHLDLTPAESKQIIVGYRTTHDKVVYFWKSIEHFFKFTVAYKAVREFRGLRIQWEPNEDIVSIRLPNTRKLYYHSPRVHGDTVTTVEHPHLWGGVLTENIVQAMSRDVLVDNIRALEQQGLHVCHHVHDEVVICVDEKDADAVLEKTIQVFKIPPTWAPDWPVSGAGKAMKRYGK
jgi:DNA polymerase